MYTYISNYIYLKINMYTRILMYTHILKYFKHLTSSTMSKSLPFFSIEADGPVGRLRLAQNP